VDRLSNAFWTLVVGAIVLYAFFVAMGALSPTDLFWLTGLMLVLAVLLLVHLARMHRLMSEHGHDEQMREVHKWRERRGF
jgi:uncharacterized membrane protein